MHNTVLEYFTYHRMPDSLIWFHQNVITGPSRYSVQVRTADKSPAYLQYPFINNLPAGPFEESVASKSSKGKDRPP